MVTAIAVAAAAAAIIAAAMIVVEEAVVGVLTSVIAGSGGVAEEASKAIVPEFAKKTAAGPPTAMPASAFVAMRGGVMTFWPCSPERSVAGLVPSIETVVGREPTRTGMKRGRHRIRPDQSELGAGSAVGQRC